LKGHRHIIISFLPLLLCHAFFFIFPSAGFAAGHDRIGIQTDTVPKTEKPRKGIARYFNIITDRQQRDSLLSKLSRENSPVPTSDSILWDRRQNNFSPYHGKIIRNIYYNQLKVFGTQIEDTAYTTSMKLIHFANKLHLNTQEWMIRQSLFFRENDTVNAYKMVDNERYLRSLSFIQDARIYVINTYQDSDSIDVVVLTKDLFEYGGNISNLDTKTVSANVFNTNLLGAGQRVLFGFRWDSDYSPRWRSEMAYSKYNIGGSFVDASIGYSSLNNRIAVDTGAYEKSYYVSINRPLYSAWAKFTGGLTFAYNASINIHAKIDTQYRSYRYNILDTWGGYNFSNQFKNNGYNSSRPNIAIELRQYNVSFTKSPEQPYLKNNPNYNDHHYTLGRLVFFHQEFYKTNYFFGYGRTEDIPLGYNISASAGPDSWVGRKRTYAALEAQKYWLPGKNLISANVGIGGYWYNGSSEDAVIHVQGDYYSNLFRLRGPKLRQFFHADYIICPNPVLYKPVNINREFGILAYRNTLLNNYQRLNLSAQTNYYSPLNIYGFKFNFYALVQTALLAGKNESIFKGPLYSSFGLGCTIRNENLSFNTIQISASYQPPVAGSPKTFFAQITSISALRFNIFALQAPAPILFR
jgi:hypothetical protein